MKIVIDSNILFSALIKDSVTRRLILESKELFLFPSYIFNEMNNHKDLLLRKSGMNKLEFSKLLGILLQRVLIVPDEVLLQHKKEAIKIIEKIDINDVTFIACCLAYNNSILWSDDKKLKEQTIVKVINTKEMLEL